MLLQKCDPNLSQTTRGLPSEAVPCNVVRDQRNLSSRTMLQALNRMDDSTPLRRLRKVHERAERLLGQFPPIP